MPQNSWSLCPGSHRPSQVYRPLCWYFPPLLTNRCPFDPHAFPQSSLTSSPTLGQVPSTEMPILAIFTLKFPQSFRRYAICHPFLERFSQSRSHAPQVWGAHLFMPDVHQHLGTFHTRAFSGGYTVSLHSSAQCRDWQQ